VLVLGLKRDARSGVEDDQLIYPPEGHRVAQELRADRYMECSAITGELLEEAFEDLCTSGIKTTTEAGGQSEGNCGIM
jgi:hypothetical protein